MTIKVFSVSEMNAAEKAADAAGISYEEMMETAGRCVAEAIMERIDVGGKQVLALVGPGNNGGDGLVAGRYLAEAGADVQFYLFKPRIAAVDKNYALVQQMSLFCIEAGADLQFQLLRTRLNSSEILIDALLGTGVTRPIKGDLAQLMQQVQIGIADKKREPAFNGRSRLTPTTQMTPPLRMQGPLIAAVDCPSGLNCDTGALDPLAIPAHLTVTFAGPKRGHFCFPGAAACGELIVADIDIDPDLPVVAAVPLELATAVAMRDLLPPRPLAGHKGTFGTALIAAGSQHYFGAPLLAALGAYRVGAGLVALAIPETIRATVAGQLPEATYPPLSAVEKLDAAAAAYILESVSANSLLVGPGLDTAVEFMTAMLENPQKLPPLIVDADGLNILAQMPDWPQKLPPNTILTPHPGEMARLLGKPLAEIKAADRIELAREKATAWGHIVLLKGAFTIVAAPDGRCHIMPFANPALAVGGSGDVLSGVIAGLLAQGLAPYATAVLGAFLHGAAGQLAAAEKGTAGVLAAEIAQKLPQARKHMLNGA